MRLLLIWYYCGIPISYSFAGTYNNNYILDVIYAEHAYFSWYLYNLIERIRTNNECTHQDKHVYLPYNVFNGVLF